MTRIQNHFCNKNTSRLHERTKEKFLNFFNFYHASQLEELKIFLENDGWDLCPVKSSFEISQLLEFQTLKRIFNSYQLYKNTSEYLFENFNLQSSDWALESIDTVIEPLNTLLDESTEDFLQDLEVNKI